MSWFNPFSTRQYQTGRWIKTSRDGKTYCRDHYHDTKDQAEACDDLVTDEEGEGEWD